MSVGVNKFFKIKSGKIIFFISSTFTSRHLNTQKLQHHIVNLVKHHNQKQ